MRTLKLAITTLLILSASMWSFGTVSAQGEDEPQIRITQVDNSNFPNVTVYVSVTNAAGEPVGIDPSTIQVYEGDQLMQPVNVTGGGSGTETQSNTPVTTMLVMDISGSMDKNGKLDAAKEAAKSYVNRMRAGDQIGLMTFDTQTYYVQPLTTDKDALLNAIEGIKTGGDTAMYNALIQAEKELENVSGRKTIIALADGLDNHSQSTVDDVINAIGPSGTTISTIGFGDASTAEQAGLDEAAMKSLAERSGGVYSFTADDDTLNALYQQYSRTLQSEYAFTYVSPLTLRDGVNRHLKVSLADTAVTTNSQYNPGGVLPEVAAGSWSLFGMILLGLLVLLAIPFLFNLVTQKIGSSGGGGGNAPRKKSRIKMDQMPGTSSTKGRIKIR